MKVIGSSERYFERAHELSALLGGESATVAAVCARGWALVQRLRRADFVGTEGQGDEACDIYQLTVRGKNALGQLELQGSGTALPDGPFLDAARALRGTSPEVLRVALMPYRFDGRPLVLVITISALAGGSR